MLEVTSTAQEDLLGIDFSEIYRRSELYQLATLHAILMHISELLTKLLLILLNHHRFSNFTKLQ